MYKGKHKYGFGIPEGAFYPMKMVNDFIAFMENWLESHGENSTYIVNMKLYAEAFWLQYYALNLADPPPPSDIDYQLAQPPCWRHIITDQGHDSVPMDELKLVMEGADLPVAGPNGPLWSNYYAVKRVNR